MGRSSTTTTTVNPQQAFVHQNGTMTRLGSLGNYSAAFDINDNDVIAGRYEILNKRTGQTTEHAFVYADGAVQDLLGQLSSKAGWTQLFSAIGLNNTGDIVGSGRLGKGSAARNRGFVASPVIAGTLSAPQKEDDLAALSNADSDTAGLKPFVDARVAESFFLLQNSRQDEQQRLSGSAVLAHLPDRPGSRGRNIDTLLEDSQKLATVGSDLPHKNVELTDYTFGQFDGSAPDSLVGSLLAEDFMSLQLGLWRRS